MKKAKLELYTNYLISPFSAATATELSTIVDGDISPDSMTRFLSEQKLS